MTMILLLIGLIRNERVTLRLASVKHSNGTTDTYFGRTKEVVVEKLYDYVSRQVEVEPDWCDPNDKQDVVTNYFASAQLESFAEDAVTIPARSMIKLLFG